MEAAEVADEGAAQQARNEEVGREGAMEAAEVADEGAAEQARNEEVGRAGAMEVAGDVAKDAIKRRKTMGRI